MPILPAVRRILLGSDSNRATSNHLPFVQPNVKLNRPADSAYPTAGFKILRQHLMHRN